jgi:hypothetical protein
MTDDDRGFGHREGHHFSAGWCTIPLRYFGFLSFPHEAERACHPERRRREEPALSAAKGSAFTAGPPMIANEKQIPRCARDDKPLCPLK